MKSVKIKLVKKIQKKVFDRFKRRLKILDKQVFVGFPENGKREKAGTLVATIAAVHHYGVPEQGIPERPSLRFSALKN